MGEEPELIKDFGKEILIELKFRVVKKNLKILSVMLKILNLILN